MGRWGVMKAQLWVSIAALALVAALPACGRPAPIGGASAVPTVSLQPALTPTPTSTPSSAPVTPIATPTSAPPAGFAYTDFSGGTLGVGSAAVAARVGSHDGYDRFVLEFAGAVPAYTIKRQPQTTFTLSPQGTPVTLRGTSGVLIALQPVVDWTSYRGPTHLVPDFPYLREATQLENFEAVQQWALGVQGDAALRVITLTSPSRLVIDVSA